jgi:hypothetical protein
MIEQRRQFWSSGFSRTVFDHVLRPSAAAIPAGTVNQGRPGLVTDELRNFRVRQSALAHFRDGFSCLQLLKSE